MRIVFLEVVAERKCHDREACIVIRTGFAFDIRLLSFLILEFTLFAVNIADLLTVS